MPVCTKCHRFKHKHVYKRHERKCIPSKEEIAQYLRCKGVKHSDDCSCEMCRQKRAK